MESALNWRKSSYTGANGGDCVEVAALDAAPDFKPDAVLAVRDSKNPDRALLYFNPREWDAFLKGVKDGEFDDFTATGESPSER